jgi:hypothetical protein
VKRANPPSVTRSWVADLDQPLGDRAGAQPPELAERRAALAHEYLELRDNLLLLQVQRLDLRAIVIEQLEAQPGRRVVAPEEVASRERREPWLDRFRIGPLLAQRGARDRGSRSRRSDRSSPAGAPPGREVSARRGADTDDAIAAGELLAPQRPNTCRQSSTAHTRSLSIAAANRALPRFHQLMRRSSTPHALHRSPHRARQARETACVVHPDHDHLHRPFVGCVRRSRSPADTPQLGRCHAPIKSRRRSSAAAGETAEAGQTTQGRQAKRE